MSPRRLLAALGAVAVVLALQTTPAYAAVTDLYVAATGDDGNPCTDQLPCATIQHAVDVADTSGTTVHVGAGTFTGEVQPAPGQSITIAGDTTDPTDPTTLTAPSVSADGFVVGARSGSVSLSDLTLDGSMIDLFVDGTGQVSTDHVTLAAAGCDLVVAGGHADLQDSTATDGGLSGCLVGSTPTVYSGDVVQLGGSLAVAGSQVLDPEQGSAAATVAGGVLTVDQSFFDDTRPNAPTNSSGGVVVSGGTTTVTRSAFHGFGAGGVETDGGTATLTDDTFAGNVVGVTSTSGTTTVVRSTFLGEVGSLQNIGTGTLGVAGSVLGADSVQNCNGTVTDLGYNLATDDSCAFTGTSHDGVTGLNLDTDLSDRGGPVPTVAIFNPSSALDTIPVGATYGHPAAPLCPATGATDLRGVPRPVGGACDAGSMEMAGTTTTLAAPTSAKPRQDVELVATVETPYVGVEGLETPVGTVTFHAGSQVLCSGGRVFRGVVRCTTSALAVGRRRVTATFVPAPDASTLHPSTSPTKTIVVGTGPRITSPHRLVVRVGRRATLTVRGAGSPLPRLSVVRGRVPKGMKVVKRAGRLRITGRPKPAARGRHRLLVRATNVAGSVTHRLTIVVRRP